MPEEAMMVFRVMLFLVVVSCCTMTVAVDTGILKASSSICKQFPSCFEL